MRVYFLNLTRLLIWKYKIIYRIYLNEIKIP